MNKTSKSEALKRLDKAQAAIPKLKKLPIASTEFQKWKRNTEVAIENTFGETSRHVRDFKKVNYSLMVSTGSTPLSAFERAYIRGLESAESVLESMIEEVQEYWDDEKPKRPKAYTKDENMINVSLPKSKDVWNAIEDEYGSSKRNFATKINFIKDKFMRDIIYRDIEHAYVLAKNGFSKPSVILAGSVMEELLRQYLKHMKVKPISDTYDGYIKTCIEHNLLKSAIHSLTDSFRYFRNFVHLAKEKSKRHTISKATANGAVASIFTTVNDFE